MLSHKATRQRQRNRNHNYNPANLTRKNCPAGYITRKAYTRKFRSSLVTSGYTVRRKGKLFTVHPTASSVHVGPTCIKERSSSSNNKMIGKLRKGDLIKYGYQYRLSDRLREKALLKAIDVYGARTVYHKLNAVAKLSVRTAPDASKIFRRDREWIHGMLKTGQK